MIRIKLFCESKSIYFLCNIKWSLYFYLNPIVWQNCSVFLHRRIAIFYVLASLFYCHVISVLCTTFLFSGFKVYNTFWFLILSYPFHLLTYTYTYIEEYMCVVWVCVHTCVRVCVCVCVRWQSFSNIPNSRYNGEIYYMWFKFLPKQILTTNDCYSERLTMKGCLVLSKRIPRTFFYHSKYAVSIKHISNWNWKYIFYCFNVWNIDFDCFCLFAIFLY